MEGRTRGGGFHAIKSGGNFLIIQNDTKDGVTWKGEAANDEVWIRKLNAKAEAVKEYRFEAGKNPICPRRTFVNMNGELIFIGEKPVGQLHIGENLHKESTFVGRLTLN